MPLLAYCLMEAAAQVEKPLAGVGGLPIEELREFGLRCFFSRWDSGEQLARIPAVESALAFHRVLQALFRQAALLSFRFPALLSNEEELRQRLQQRSSQYREALSRLRDMVQMEVHIGGGQQPESAQPASGREYLRQRQSQLAGQLEAAERIREATRPWVVEWRQHQAGAGLRCYALLPRQSVGGFQNAVRTVGESRLPARLSGPWPAAEFLEVKDF